MVKQLAVFWILCGMVLCPSSVAMAHPFHVSIAEVEWNAKTKKLQVALLVQPEDLEKVLQQRTKTTDSLEKMKNLDAHIEKYLEENFLVIAPNKKKGKLLWVGKEIGLKTAWLYFEVECEKGPEGSTFSNQMFFETLEDQSNTITLQDRRQKRRQSITFTLNNRQVEFQWEKKANTEIR